MSDKRTNVELVEISDVDGEGLIGGRTVRRCGSDNDGSHRAVRLTIYRTGDCDNSAATVDCEASAVIVEQRITDAVYGTIGVNCIGSDTYQRTNWRSSLRPRWLMNPCLLGLKR